MPALADHPTLRRLQAAALVAAPLAGLATTSVWLQTPLDTAARLEVLADGATRMQLAHALNLLTILLFIPALGGMHRLLQPRRPRAAAVGTSLVAAGLVGWSGVLAMSSAELQLAQTLPTRSAVEGAEALQSSLVGGLMLVLFLLATFSGLVVLTTALWRATVVPGWVPAAVTLAVSGDVVGSTVTVVVVAVWLLLLAALGAVAGARLRERGNGAIVAEDTVPAVVSDRAATPAR